MTRCTVFRSSEEAPKPLGKIEFVKHFNGKNISPAVTPPRDWNNIQLINRASGDMDIMYAWDNDPLNGCVYSGHWNGGVV